MAGDYRTQRITMRIFRPFIDRGYALRGIGVRIPRPVQESEDRIRWLI
jgi:hypothetical protein